MEGGTKEKVVEGVSEYNSEYSVGSYSGVEYERWDN